MSLDSEIKLRFEQGQSVDICILAKRVIRKITLAALRNHDYNEKEDLISQFHEIIENESREMYKE